YIVDVLPSEIPPFFRSGMTANVTFLIESKKNVLVVPTAAIKVREDARYVLIKSDDEKPNEKTISVGASDGKRTEIIDGLQENEAVLVADIRRGEGKDKDSPKNPFNPINNRRGGR